MTIGEAYRKLLADLGQLYEAREAQNIANVVIEHITGFGNTTRLLHKQDLLSANQLNKYEQASQELLSGIPVQYVLHEAYFFGMKLYVDESVLIPRPETEELVDWLLHYVQNEPSSPQPKIIDIGTGSGCIPIAIKKKISHAFVAAVDVSKKALNVAKKNANQQEVAVAFFNVDILNRQQWEALPAVHYIISNPPYITKSEAASMNENVLNHEPHLALFIDDDNPLLFYDAIADFGLAHLVKPGKLFFEINETFGNEVVFLLGKKGYLNVELKQDMQGKNRLVKGELH